MTKEPQFDKDGYPTDETLETVRAWDDLSFDGQVELLNYVRKAWDTRVGAEFVEARACIFVTGGWSGNEELIYALEDNTLFWMLCWYKSQRGGYYEFIPRRTE